MHGELLHGAVDRCAQDLQPRSLGGLDDILREPGSLGLGLSQLAKPCAAEFLDRLLALRDHRRERRFGFLQVALLNGELLLLLDQLIEVLEIENLRPDFPLHQGFAHVNELLLDRDQRLDLGDRRGICRSFGLPLRPLPIECGKLGALLRGLIDQQLTLCRQQPLGRVLRRMKGGQRVALGECRVQPRDVELRRNEIAFKMPQFGVADRRIELD